jgi:hypothetical protein
MSTAVTPPRHTASPGDGAGIDPRGPQFNAAVTVVVLVAILVTSTPVAVTLTFLQAILFAIGVIAGPAKTPHAFVFRQLVQPRIGRPTELEDPAPPRFAQGVGLVFTVAALVLFAVGTHLGADIAIGLALVAAVLNAVFRFCLGCELYLLIKRFTH